MSWVSVWRVPPPSTKVVSVRFGSSICFAAYSRILNQWFLCANGKEEKIEEPTLWWCNDPEYAKTHQRELSEQPIRRENPLRIRKERAEQLLLLT